MSVVHLRLVPALDGEDIVALSQRTGNAWGPGRTAVLNGVFVDARFSEGELVKIALALPYEPRSDRERRARELAAPDPTP